MFSDMQCQFHKIQKFNFNEFIFVKLTRLALERLAAVYSLSCDSHVMVWLLNYIIIHCICSNAMHTELYLKEVLHIHPIPENQLFNCSLGTDIPGCWIPWILVT